MENNGKRILFILLFAVGIFGMMDSCKGWKWCGCDVEVKAAEADENGFLINEYNRLVSYQGMGGEIVIPQGVTEIGYRAFYECNGITSISIPFSVTKIADYAFSKCSELIKIQVDENNENYTSVDGILFDKNMGKLLCYPAGKKTKEYDIPFSVKNIGKGAFSGCSGLISVNIPSSVISIENSAFSDCSGLVSMNIPSSVTSIGESVFNKCSGLTSVEIPSSITEIGYYVFGGCSGLTSVEIPTSITNIGIGAFYECSSLQSIEIPSGVVNIGNSAFKRCNGLISVKIPSSVTNIENFAFEECIGLTSVEIPLGVISIGAGVFRGCSGLTAISIPDSVTVMDTILFYETNKNFKIYCHKNSYAHTYADNCYYPYVLVEGDVGEAMYKALEEYENQNTSEGIIKESKNNTNTSTARGELILKKKIMILEKGQKGKIKIISELDKVVTYKSLDCSIATVNKKGVVTARKKGKTSIVVKVNGQKSKVKVIVKSVSSNMVELRKNLELSKKKVVLKKGNKLTVQKSSSISGKLTFHSLNKTIASVSIKGVVKARQKGKTAILIKNGGKTVKLKITVKR